MIDNHQSLNVVPGELSELLPRNIDYQRLNSTVKIHEELFEEVYYDICRILDGGRMLFGLDFDHIYAYLEPAALHREGRGLDSVAISYVLERGEGPFVLLPGTVIEIARYVGRLQRTLPEEARQLERYLRDIEEADLKSLARVLESEDTEADQELARPPLGKRVRLLRDLLRKAETQIQQFQKLEGFLQRTCVIILDEAMDSLPPIAPFQYDEDMEAGLQELFGRIRPGLYSQNLADASNFTSIASLSQAVTTLQGRGKPIPYLMTRTEMFLKPSVETMDARYGVRRDILKYPVSTLYWTMAEQQFPDMQKRYDRVKQAKNLATLSKLSLEEVARPGLEGPLDPFERLQAALRAAVIQKSFKQVNDLMQYLNDTFFEQIEDFLTANNTVNQNKQVFSGSPPSPLLIADVFNSMTKRSKVLLASVVSAVQQKLLTSGTKPSKPGLEIIGRMFTKLHEVESRSVGLEVKEILLRDRAKRLIIGLVQLPDGSRSVYWPMATAIDETCALIDRVLLAAKYPSLNALVVLPGGKTRTVTISRVPSYEFVMAEQFDSLPLVLQIELPSDEALLCFDLQPVVSKSVMYISIQGTRPFIDTAASLFMHSSAHAIFTEGVRRFLHDHW